MSFFTEFSEIIKDNKSILKELPLKLSVNRVKRIVEELVEKAGLPNVIAGKYKEFGEDESLLYFSQSYRDHFFHPFHTFLLGFAILKKLNNIKSKQPLPLKVDDEFLKKWLVASLWHDITYAAEKCPEWLNGYIEEKLKFKINASITMDEVLTDEKNMIIIDDLVKKFASKNRQDKIPFRTWLYQQLSTNKDHAILSAILLIKEYKKNKGKQWEKTGITKEMCNECALSIAMHNFPKAKLYGKEGKDGKKVKPTRAIDIGPLDINDFQLAYLLSFCDTAQEWGRPVKRNPSKYIRFKNVDIVNKEKKIFIELDFDIKEYIKNAKINEKISLDEDGAWGKIVSKWEKEIIKALEISWKRNSDNWKFLIHLNSINKKNADSKKVVAHS